MSLEVIRHRQVETDERDRYNKPATVLENAPFAAFAFAPTVAGDSPLTDALEATIGGAIYFRDAMVDSRPTDEWTVRGVRYDAEGYTAEWIDPHGTLKGCVITLKRQELARA